MSIPSSIPSPSSSADAALLFKDAASCARWVATLPITNVQLVQQTLADQITALATANLAALERLKIIEAMKETVLFAQAELAKRYIGKPLPLDQSDLKAWDSVMGLWRAMGVTYRVCLDAFRAGDLTLAPHAALLTLRCLRTAAYGLFEHYMIYREPDADTWRGFHQLYAYAEEQGLSRVRVTDVFNKRDADSSCAEAYVQGLMANLANPFALSVRQMAFLRRWLEKWASQVELSRQPLPLGQIPPLAVDFASDAPPALAAQVTHSETTRYFDFEPLSKTLRQTLNLLKQGQTPGQLGLGEDARQPGCESLIMLLYLQWCRAGTLRTENRNPIEDPAEVCFGISDAFNMAGGDARSKREVEFNARDKWEMDNLGFSMRLSNTAKQAAVKKTEAWQVLNQSNSGFMCMLREPSGVMRMMHNQLLGIRRFGDTPKLGTVQWIRVGADRETQCGVRLFQGTPQPIKVRPANFNVPKGQDFEVALMTPAVTMPATPATVMLPAGWFQSGRLLELEDDTRAEKKQLIKLLTLLERGADFDRCSMEMQ